jgi:hypothetical protein
MSQLQAATCSATQPGPAPAASTPQERQAALDKAQALVAREAEVDAGASPVAAAPGSARPQPRRQASASGRRGGGRQPSTADAGAAASSRSAASQRLMKTRSSASREAAGADQAAPAAGMVATPGADWSAGEPLLHAGMGAPASPGQRLLPSKRSSAQALPLGRMMDAFADGAFVPPRARPRCSPAPHGPRGAGLRGDAEGEGTRPA